jgi:response regulator RpfG family c-di-GMP phosphodiesterase
MWSKILQYIDNLFQYEDNTTNDNNNKNEIVSNYDNFIASRDYDRTITVAAIQPKQYQKNLKQQQKEEDHKTKIIMIIDDNYDTSLTFKKGLEAENNKSTNNNTFFEVHTYNHPELALSEFKPNFYNLLLIDINMPVMNGFELSTKILEIDPNPKICFMSSAEVNHEALREIYPAINIGCFIKKPISVEYLVRRVKAELE